MNVPRASSATEPFRVWLRDDGLVQISWHPATPIDRSAAEAAVSVISEAGGGATRGLLVDMRSTGTMDRAARGVFAGSNPGIGSVALWVESPLSVVIANFFLGLSKSANATRLFTDEDEAVAWLHRASAPDRA